MLYQRFLTVTHFDVKRTTLKIYVYNFIIYKIYNSSSKYVHLKSPNGMNEMKYKYPSAEACKQQRILMLLIVVVM